MVALMSYSEFQKYKDDILKFIDDIDGLEKEIAERLKVLKFIFQVFFRKLSLKILIYMSALILILYYKFKNPC